MLDWLKNNKYTLMVIAVLIAVITALGIAVSEMKDKSTINEANLKAATQEIVELRRSNGDLLVEKQSFVGKIEDLEGQLDITKKELKDLEKTLDSKVLYISELESKIRIEDKETVDTVIIYRDSSMSFTFSFSDDWYNLDGHSLVSGREARTTMDKLYINAPLEVGLTENWEIFVTTPNPYISFSDIRGAVLDKSAYLKETKVKRWSVSVYGGFNLGYDVIGKGFYAGPGIGIGVCYRLF